MSNINESDLDDVLAKAKALAMGDHPLDNMTIKDLKLSMQQNSQKVNTNDQQASIISVFIITT